MPEYDNGSYGRKFKLLTPADQKSVIVEGREKGVDSMLALLEVLADNELANQKEKQGEQDPTSI